MLLRLILLSALALCPAAHAEPWAEGGSVTVETRTNDNRVVKVERHTRGDERLVVFANKAGTLRLLVMPSAVLLGGFPAQTTCDGAADAPAYFESFAALSLHYLDKAIPQGPQGLEPDGMTKRQLTIPAGRLMLGPGNYVELPRPLTVKIEAERQDNVIRYRVFERGVSDPQNKARRYTGTWSSTLMAAFPEDRSPLNEWLACARGKPLTGPATIGELRAMRAKKKP